MDTLTQDDKQISITKENYGVEGMSCASCAVSLQTYLESQEGVESVTVNYPNQSAIIQYHPEIVTPDNLQRYAKEIGYGLITGNGEEKAKVAEVSGQKRLTLLKKKLIVAAVFSVPVFVMAMFFMDAFPLENWVMLLLSLPVLAWSGSEFFINAWKRARHAATNMDTLVALSTGVAFLFSVFNTVYPSFFLSRGLTPHVYYESATIIITLILLGRFLEEKAKSKTSSAIKKLMGLQPKQVVAIRNGEEVILPIHEVIVGDLLVIRPGDKIPVDGQVKSGSSFVDESMISGEAIPLKKERKDAVFTGTINQQGTLKILARQVGNDTLLAQMIRLVQEAQATKPPVQKLVDKIAAVFVPVVIALSFIAFAIWFFLGPAPSITYAFLILITVLIIACPCALGLATPTALMVGIGKGAQQGILIKNAESLETAYKINTLVLDKTGTITEGKPSLTDAMWQTGKASEQWLGILLGLEAASEHPIGKAVSQYLKDQQVQAVAVEHFEAVPGHGVKAVYEGVTYLVGNQQLMQEHRIAISQEMEEKAGRLEEEAKTTIYFASETEVLAVLAVADKIRANAAKAVVALKKMDIDIIMLTGDSQATAAAIAREAGIDQYQAQVLPADKGNFIKALQSQGKVVAMAGDGINDAHALAQADIGMAMGSGTDIAMESAGITLMNSDLMHIVRAIRLSRATIRTIRQNLFWAFIYNVIAIPVAAGLLYPAFGFLLNPMIAGAAMAMSSVSVVTNSLRLRNIRIE